MLVSSDPKELVATQVNKAESPLSDRFMLKSDKTPLGRISSRIVYLKKKNEIHLFNGILFLGRSTIAPGQGIE